MNELKIAELYNDIRIKGQDKFEDLDKGHLDKFDQVKSNVNLSDLKRKAVRFLETLAKTTNLIFLKMI